MANNITELDYVSPEYIQNYDVDQNIKQKIIDERLRAAQPFDLDLLFTINSFNFDLAVKKGSNSIKQAVKNLLLTDYYEKLFRPNIGSNIKQILFEPVDFISERLLEDSIRSVIENYEPRVNLISVTVSANQTEYGYDIVITYSIRNSNDVQTIETFLQSTRG